MSFSPVWLIVAAALVIAAVLMWIFLRNKLPRRIPGVRKPAAPAQMSEEDLTSLKKLYLEKMALTEQELKDGKLTLREAYQRMSADMREFVKRATGVPVREMTLAEISELKIPSLTELVRDYYEPEFAYYTEADAHRSFERTCQVIRKWARTWMIGHKEQFRQAGKARQAGNVRQTGKVRQAGNVRQEKKAGQEKETTQKKSGGRKNR